MKIFARDNKGFTLIELLFVEVQVHHVRLVKTIGVDQCVSNFWLTNYVEFANIK